MRSLRHITALVLAWLAMAMLDAAHAAAPWMMQLRLQGQSVEGQPLFWSTDEVVLLGRDGQLWRFAPAEAQDFRRTAERFQSYSQAELRGRLQHEFGRAYDVSGTGHYLVVHPAGQRDQWAPRFETIYRSFLHYFAARGLRLREPEVPLIAVVFPRREEFRRYAAQSGDSLLGGTVGYYSPTSNRVLLYDGEAGAADAWHENAETIIHEAAHQCAFNTGIHSRHAPAPRWVVEGLGTLFEAPGVWDAIRYPRRQDRVQKELLAAFRRYQRSGRRTGALAEFVSSDRIFHSDSEAAYAESWALTFFLCETQPRKYFDYLQLTAQLPPGKPYSAPARLRDFTQTFGANLQLLEAQFIRFIDQL